MNYLLKPISKNLLKQKSTLLLFAIPLFPLLIIVASFVNTNFMQLGGEAGSISALAFISAIISTQHQFIFPFIILAYISVTLFYDEIKSGRLIIFKDTRRSKILSAKRSSVFLVFTAYFVLICLTSALTYYVYINQLTIATHTFLPSTTQEIQQVVVEISGLFLTEIIGLSVALTVSIFLTSGYTILVTIFYQLLSLLAPNLASMRYFFPTGYKMVLDSMAFPIILLAMLGVTLLFLLISRSIATRLFQRIEY